MKNVILTFTSAGLYHCKGIGAPFPLLIDGALHQIGCQTCPMFTTCRMSHWTSHEVIITDIEALRLACREMGLELLQNATARGYKAYHEADNRLQGEFVIRLKGPYDVAVNKKPDGKYALTTDWWNGHVAKEVGENYGKLLQLYGVHKAAIAARKQGYLVSRQPVKNGAIQLRISCP
jgi:hypothetical protein